jgi:ATP-dependent DNA helicase RecQ
VRIPRLLAAKSTMGDASVHAVVYALEAASGRITPRELAEASKVSRHGVERFVNELLRLEVLRVDGNDAVSSRRVAHDGVTGSARRGSFHPGRTKWQV